MVYFHGTPLYGPQLLIIYFIITGYLVLLRLSGIYTEIYMNRLTYTSTKGYALRRKYRLADACTMLLKSFK